MTKVLLTLVLCGLFASGCSLNPVQSEPLSPSELNTNAAHYNGQTIVVRGYAILVPEGHALYESRALNNEFRRGVDAGGRFDVNKYEKYCLTIANPDLLYKNQVAVKGKTLIVRGKFIDNYLNGKVIDLGACPLPTAIIIDENDLRQRYGSLLTAK